MRTTAEQSIFAYSPHKKFSESTTNEGELTPSNFVAGKRDIEPYATADADTPLQTPGRHAGAAVLT
jgi:hypothetical protein